MNAFLIVFPGLPPGEGTFAFRDTLDNSISCVYSAHMERIQNVLAQYTDTDVSLPGRRQLNAALLLDDYAKLEVMSRLLKTTKRRLASDLLGAAVQDAFDQVADSAPAAFHEDMQQILDILQEQEGER